MKTLSVINLGFQETYPEIGADDHCKNFAHCFVTKRVHANDVKVTQESWSDVISATTWGSHCSKELNVL